MEKIKISKIMLSKLKPKMFDKKWITAIKLMRELELKSVKFREAKEKRFIYLVDELYKD